MSTVRFAAYGTLRKGSYNYDRFKHVFGDDFNYIETKETQGIAMYDNGSYPLGVLAPVDVVVDVIECSTECYDIIESMERSAGYGSKLLKVGDESLRVFVYTGSIYGYKKVIKDWIKHEENKK